MKQRTKIIFLAYSALVIFMSSACIYMSHMIKSRYQDTSSEINIYKNVYVTNIEDNMITANMYGNIKKFNSGKIAEDVTGCLCDITVENGKIVGVNTKTDVVSGKVLSVSQGSVEIEGYGSVKLDEDFIMYEKENSLISKKKCVDHNQCNLRNFPGVVPSAPPAFFLFPSRHDMKVAVGD